MLGRIAFSLEGDIGLGGEINVELRPLAGLGFDGYEAVVVPQHGIAYRKAETQALAVAPFLGEGMTRRASRRQGEIWN